MGRNIAWTLLPRPYLSLRKVVVYWTFSFFSAYSTQWIRLVQLPHWISLGFSFLISNMGMSPPRHHTYVFFFIFEVNFRGPIVRLFFKLFVTYISQCMQDTTFYILERIWEKVVNFLYLHLMVIWYMYWYIYWLRRFLISFSIDQRFKFLKSYQACVIYYPEKLSLFMVLV
jgi:hypothetical protein